MALTPRDTHEGLSKLLEGEQQPLYPKLRGPNTLVELEKWIQNLYVYLRRITGHFSADNIISLLVDNHIENFITAGGFVKSVRLKYHWTSKPSTTTTITVDSSVDWRKYALLFSYRSKDVTTPTTGIAADINAGIGSGTVQATTYPNPAGYPKTLFTAGGGVITITCQVSTTGVLELKFAQSPAASDAYLDAQIHAYHLVEAEGSAGTITV